MPFQFGGPQFPMPLKIARSLIGVEVVILFYAFLILVVGQLLSSGGNSSISVSGAVSSPVWAVAFLGAAAVLLYLAFDLGKLRLMTRNVLVGFQVLLLVLVLVGLAGDAATTWPSIIFAIAVAGGIVYCLFAPGATAAFAAGGVAAKDEEKPVISPAIQELFDAAAKTDADTDSKPTDNEESAEDKS